ncbi:magnesium chelatase subunit D family protein [Gordonia jinhuaensis]|uniref:Magnesium-chelatase n=1 Tax=Gordonia jinhuaensis TaxID=1517702 RepID=A0A916T253_9ACTN|nr:putative magnesium-chelatase [Gordonia jinhuaensis]
MSSAQTDTGATPDLDASRRSPTLFPFSAVVGADRLKLALILSAITPEIGGVLVAGQKGTAKTTAVRALAGVLSRIDTSGRARVVELPIGATEDRVIGSIDIERMLHDGRQVFTPGVLADADGGMLYIDEVNLLADHLVDVLLDAAATGRVVVERDGVSHGYSARFVMVGTMNPEEGELRPQLLDRFGLFVDVAAPADVDARVEVVSRRLAFDADPDAFAAAFADAETQLAQQISDARAMVGQVALPHVQMRRIAAVCAALDVDGLRGDIVVARTARAHAAWRGAEAVEESDVRVAVELALAHRRRRDAFDDTGISEQQLDDAMESAARQADPPSAPPPADDRDGAEQDGESGRDASGSGGRGPDDRGPDDGGPGGPDDDPPGGGVGAPQDCPTGTGRAPQGSMAMSEPTSRPRTTLRAKGIGDSGAPGRRSRTRSRSGRVVRADTRGHGLHMIATARTAAERHGVGELPVRISAADVVPAQRHAGEANLVVFVVDLSGSMAARRRLDAVSQACVALLRDSYQRRDQVAVITMAGVDAQIAVPPTRSVQVARRGLEGRCTGGRTPLAEGLTRGWEVIARSQRHDQHRRPLLVVLTDGRATAGRDALPRARAVAEQLRRRIDDSVVIDCESGPIRLGLAADLAGRLGARRIALEEFLPGSLGQMRPAAPAYRAAA